MKSDSFVEITRSYGFKLNIGNFQSADFFCSQKAQCAFSQAEATSEALYAFCRAQVLKAVAEHKGEYVEMVNTPTTQPDRATKTGTKEEAENVAKHKIAELESKAADASTELKNPGPTEIRPARGKRSFSLGGGEA